MQNLFRYFFLFCLFLQMNGYSQGKSKQPATGSNTYQCIPCGHDCDKETVDHPGTCASCNMPLVKVSTITFHTLQPAAICNYIKLHPDVVLLDVRTKAEFEGAANPDFGTLKNAINIPIQELGGRLTEIAKLKNKDIIVFCSHSHRSPQASYLLTQNGFSKVTNLAGGMSVMKDRSCMK